jgi:hypothetical protein
MAFTQPKKVNYLNNRDILKEIHRSKNTYCSYRDRELDHQYDIILTGVDRINQRTVAEARRNRADRIKRETGEIVDPKKIPNTDLVFRVTTWEHIPMVPKKLTKAQEKKKSKLEELLEMDDVDMDDDGLQDLIDDVQQDLNYTKLNFPPFYHYRIDENKTPFLVGKSHWRGDLESGEFCREHGKMTDKLAHMFIKLCERYATRSNWRGYCVDADTQALTQRGWLGFNQIDETDTILSYNGSNMVWSKIFSIFRNNFNGYMHKLDVRGMDALVTPEHKLVTDKGLVKVEHLLHTDRVVLMGDAEQNTQETYSNSFVELIGWIVTEGNYQPKKNLVSIYQNEGVNADRIRACLSKCNYRYTESTDPKNNVRFLICVEHSKKIMAQFPDKDLTMNFVVDLSTAQRDLLIDTMIEADGWTRRKSASYTQKKSTSVDLFQALCSVAGRKTNSHFRDNKMSFGKPVSYYEVNLFSRKSTRGTCIDFHGGRTSNRGHIGKGKQHYPNQPTEQYSGTVWCPETEYGCFVARRNGKVYLTGNTYNEEMRGQALLQLSQIGLQFDESKSQNPFAYYTAAITNSFTRVLNIEKKMQNIRDDILEENGLNPSYTRQFKNSREAQVLAEYAENGLSDE